MNVTRAMIRDFFRSIELSPADHTILSQRLEDLGDGDGDNEEFSLNTAVVHGLLHGYPDLQEHALTCSWDEFGAGIREAIREPSRMG